ncbi:MAG: glycosyltransferase family 2 protein [Flavobacteriaceae bacterium]|nr:glycosyltransferase family 2 protein [Flavobacteriaceae bacterium]
MISILTPFKNTAQYLTECINSVLHQSYSNWEMLLVDDHSTDNSAQIAMEFAQKDSRIKVFQNTGSGIIPALQLAYAKSSGSKITRMDSDDLMPKQKLQLLNKTLEENGKNHIAVGKVKYFRTGGVSDGYLKYERWLNQLCIEENHYDEIFKECVIPSPNWLIHRDDLERADAFNPGTYPEDYDLCFRLYEKGIKIASCKSITHYWRDYSQRTSRTHEHYAQNYFLDLKLHYYLKLCYNPQKKLVLWGAGNKGKILAKLLITKGVNFDWYCNNEQKIGHKIYNKTLYDIDTAKLSQLHQSIIAIGNPDVQQSIKSHLSKLDLQPSTDYFFFT